MPRSKSTNLTSAEQRVMEVLWRRGPSTVRDVVEAIKSEREFAYTTVLTVLRVLSGKGYVAAGEGEGRAHVFTALVTRGQAQRDALRALVAGFFGGSSEALAMHLVTDELDVNERERLESLISAAERGGAKRMSKPSARRKRPAR